MDVHQPIYDSVDNVVSPDSSRVYYESMSPDTLLDPKEEGDYQQTTDTYKYLRINLKEKSLRVQYSSKLQKIVLSLLSLIMLLILIMMAIGVALASASWSNVLNQNEYVNPSIKQSVANLSNSLWNEVSALKEQNYILGRQLDQVSKMYENCHVDLANCSIQLPVRDIKPSCTTSPLLPISKEVSTNRSIRCYGISIILLNIFRDTILWI